MTEISQDWQRLAIQDGTLVEEAHEYELELLSDTAPDISTVPTSVRYTSDVNAANKFRVNVEPVDYLNDETYLGATGRVYVDGEILFEGEVKKITMNERGDRDYGIIIDSQGKKLEGKTVDRTANNEIVYDTLAFLVDRFNDYDDYHDNLVGTDQQSLGGQAQVIGGNVIMNNGGSGTGSVTFSSVGPDADSLHTLRVKAYTPGNDDLTVTVSTSSNSVSQTITDSDSSIYGEWTDVTPGTTFDGDGNPYDISFNINGGALVINWISLTSMELDREVISPNVNETTTGETLYSYSGQDLNDNTSSQSNYMVWDNSIGSDGGYRVRQVCNWDTVRDGDFSSVPDPLASDDTVKPLPTGSTGYEPEFNPQDTIENWGLWIRHRRRPRVYAYEDFSDWTTGDNTTTSSPVYEGSTALDTADNYEETTLVTDVDCDQVRFEFSGYAYVPSGASTVDIGFQNLDNQLIYGQINVNNGTLEVYVDNSEINTSSASITTGQYVSFEVSYRTDATAGTDPLEFQFGGDSISASVSASSHVIDRCYIGGSHAYFDAMETAVTDTFGSERVDWDIRFDGESTTYSGLSPPAEEMEWNQIAEYDIGPNWSSSIDSATFEILLQQEAATSNQVHIDCAILVHNYEDWSSGDFSNTLSNNWLEKPYLYATAEKYGTQQQVTIQDYINDENISSSDALISVNSSSGAIDDWGPQQRIDSATPFGPNYPNSDSVSDNYSYPGTSYGMRVGLTAIGSTRNDNPRLGYNTQQLTEVSATVDTNDLEVLYDTRLTNNRLSAMNSLAGDSIAYFRFEGDKALIFKRGALKTNPNLNAGQIKSSFSIEDTYASCEVIGLHNIRSGVIEAADAPEYIDDHKELRDQEITTQADAIVRAKSFLDENGQVQYEGTISTMPTLAPVGSVIDGSFFSHGNDMIIKSVSYNTNRSTIQLGLQKDVVTEFVHLSSETRSTQSRKTSKGMRIPAGEDAISGNVNEDVTTVQESISITTVGLPTVSEQLSNTDNIGIDVISDITVDDYIPDTESVNMAAIGSMSVTDEGQAQDAASMSVAASMATINESVTDAIPDSAIHRWPMDEGTGTTAADSIGSNALTLNGPTWVSGDYEGGYALDYDGSNDGSQAAYIPALGGAQAFSVAFTLDLSITDSSSYGQIFENQSGNQADSVGCSFGNSSTDIIEYDIRDGSGNQLAAAGADVSGFSGLIRHVMTHDGSGGVSVYVNGSGVTDAGTNGNLDAGDSGFAIGTTTPNATENVYGDIGIDNPLVCDAELSSAEVTDDYNAQPWS